MLDKLHSELQLVESSLRQHKTGYEMHRLVCMTCGRTHPMEAKKCHPCHNTTLYPKHCTSEMRISEYFAILTQEELWPTATPFNGCSVSDLAFRFTCTRKNLKHSCAAVDGCPLERYLARLCEKVVRVKESAKGFCLSCIKMGRDWTSTKACECK
jgi:ribosomal protein L40E